MQGTAGTLTGLQGCHLQQSTKEAEEHFSADEQAVFDMVTECESECYDYVTLETGTDADVCTEIQYTEENNEPVTVKKKKLKVAPSHPGAPCNATCKRNCREKFSEERRQTLLDSYWAMNDKERRDWIFHNVTRREPKRITVTDANRESRRSLTLNYHLPNENMGDKEVVCKLFFLTTLGYHPKNDRMITSIMNGTPAEAITASKERRGRHTPGNKIDHSPIIEHIESFKPSISHYRREHAPNRRYLPSDITCQFMYTDYKEKHSDSKCCYETYRKLLKSQNISFTKLGEEECERCLAQSLHEKTTGHKVTIPTAELEEIVVEDEECGRWLTHITAANNARACYRQDAEKDWPEDYSVRSVDLQKVIMLPRLPGNKTAIFTKRIVAYNETFAAVGKSKKGTSSKKTYCVLWHEGVAKRSAEEVTSAFVKALSQPPEREIKHAVLWLDNCTAQNKNWSLMTCLAYLVNSDENNLEDITLKYFVPGHTFMSADSVHHGIERAMKQRPEGKIFYYDDFISVVEESGKNVSAIKMTNDDVLKWKAEHSQTKMKKSTFKLADMAVIKFQKGSLTMAIKACHSDEAFIEVDFGKATLKNMKCPGKLRPADRGVPKAKKADILSKLCSLMPPNRRLFWENLPETDCPDEDSDSN